MVSSSACACVGVGAARKRTVEGVRLGLRVGIGLGLDEARADASGQVLEHTGFGGGGVLGVRRAVVGVTDYFTIDGYKALLGAC